MKLSQLLTIIVIGIIIIFSMRSCHNKNTKIKSQQDVISEQNASLVEVKVKNNKIASEKITALADLKTLSESYDFLEDSLKSMGIKLKHLNSALFIAKKTTGHGSGIMYDTIIKTDTIKTSVEKKLLIEEPFFIFSAQISENDLFNYQYTVYDSLSIANTTSRKNIFSGWETKVRVLSANPKTKISGITSMTVKSREPFIVIGPSIGYGLTSSGLQPFIGITATYPIIKL